MKSISICALTIALFCSTLSPAARAQGFGRGMGWRWGDSPAAAQSAAPTSEVDAGRDRMRTFLVLRIAEALNLPEEKALQISKVLRDAEDKRRGLLAQRRDIEHSLHSAIDAGKPDQAALAKLIAQANDLDSQVAMIPETSFRQVQELLTVDQQARLVLLRPELQAQIRNNVVRRLQRGRMGP